MGRIAQRTARLSATWIGDTSSSTAVLRGVFHRPTRGPGAFRGYQPPQFRQQFGRFSIHRGPHPQLPARGTLSATAPPVETSLRGEELLTPGRSLADLQHVHLALDKAKGLAPTCISTTSNLSQEIGELAGSWPNYGVTKSSWSCKGSRSRRRGRLALGRRRQTLESGLADCMASLVKLANYTEIDLETAYLEKMRQSQDRG